MQQNYAGFWQRFLAYFVDFLILFLLGLVIQSMFGNTSFALLEAESLSDVQKIQQSSNSLLGTIISLALGVAYFLIFWVNYDGATPGKKLMAIKVTRDEGTPLTYPAAFVRYIGYIISSFSLLLFGLGYLWVIWDKKKQAWHDKIAKTVVVKTDQQPKTLLAVLLTLFTILLFILYMGAIFYRGMQLGLKEAKENKGAVRESILQERLKENQEKDSDKILSFAPSSCGLTIPIPKTTDTYQGKTRKWLLEEVPLNPNNFYVLDKDVHPVKELKGVFLGYKDASARLGGESFSVAFPGLNIYCVDNTKSLNLEEYKSLALANKNYKVTLDREEKKYYFGEIETIGMWLEGKTEDGQQIKEPAYIGVTEDKNKLLYIRSWAVSKDDPIKIQLEEDQQIITRNMQYRNSSGSQSKSSVNGQLNENVKGASTASEKVLIK